MIPSRLSIAVGRWRSFSGPVSLRAATANVAWVAAERAADIVFGTLINILVVNHLGPSRYGPFAYTMAIAGIAGIAVTMGLDEIIVAEIAARHERFQAVLGAGLMARLAAAAVICPVFLVLVLHERHVPHFDPWLVIIALQPLAAACAMPPLWFRARSRAGRTLQLRLTTLAFGAVARLLGIWFDFDTGYFAGVVLTETALLAIAGWVVAAPQGLHMSALEASVDETLAMIRRGLPLLFGALAAVTYVQLDMFFVFQIAGPVAGGLYAVASRLALLAYTLPIILFNALMPMALRNFHEDLEAAAQRIAMLLSVAFWCSVGIAIALALSADFLVAHLFTHDFAGAAALVRVFALAVPFAALGSGTLTWFVMRRAESAAFLRTFSGLIVSTVGCMLLVPRFGPTGAAIATVATFAVAGLLATPLLGNVGREAFKLQVAAVMVRRLKPGIIARSSRSRDS